MAKQTVTVKDKTTVAVGGKDKKQTTAKSSTVTVAGYTKTVNGKTVKVNGYTYTRKVG